MNSTLLRHASGHLWTLASSLLPKLRPYTCLASCPGWRVWVAWLYFNPLEQYNLSWSDDGPESSCPPLQMCCCLYDIYELCWTQQNRQLAPTFYWHHLKPYSSSCLMDILFSFYFKHIMWLPSPLQFLLKNQLITLWELPCMLSVAFPIAFNIFYFKLLSFWLQCVMVCSSVGLSCLERSVFPMGDCFLSQVREVFSYSLFKYFLRPSLSLLLLRPR